MSDQEFIIQEEKFTNESAAISQDIDRPEESASKANGITVINDTNYDVLVLVANQILGIASSGYVNKSNQLVLPAAWAWWDVYVLYKNIGAHQFMVGNRVYHHKKKGMVGYREVVKISEM